MINSASTSSSSVSSNSMQGLPHTCLELGLQAGVSTIVSLVRLHDTAQVNQIAWQVVVRHFSVPTEQGLRQCLMDEEILIL